jgi:hypothetical protein
MLEALRFSGEDERFDTCESPFIIALFDTLKGDCPPLWTATNPPSSPPLSLSMDRSAYAEAGDEPFEDA